MSILDRFVLLAYIRAYLICVVSLLSLYIVIDLFTNLDDFTEDGRTLPQVFAHIGEWYLYQSVPIFDRLCEALVLLAGMFTIAWMQRNNEVLPVLSAGVSTQRLIRPVLIGAVLFMGLGIANQELLIPHVAGQLMQKRDDPEGTKKLHVQSTYDSTGVHLEGIAAERAELHVQWLYVTLPETAQEVIHLAAKDAYYIPPQAGVRHTGGWRLLGTMPITLEGAKSDLLEALGPGEYFLQVREADFAALTRQRNWFSLASSYELYEILQSSDSRRLAPIAVLFHMRLTRFFVGMILVVLGLGLILRDQNRHIFISAGLCLAMCAVFYAVLFACKNLGDSDLIAPALAAWLPVLLFTPIALAVFDGIQT